MADQTVERLQHRYDQLMRQDDIGFIRQLPTYLATLESEKRAKNIVLSLRRAVEDELSSFKAVDEELVEGLVDIRERLAHVAPEIDNSGEPEPEVPDPARAYWKIDNLAAFDQSAAREPAIAFAPFLYGSGSDPGRIRHLTQVLGGRIYKAEWGVEAGRGPQPAEKARTDLGPFRDEVDEVLGRYNAARTHFRRQEAGLPGLAHARLELVVGRLEPDPLVRTPDEDDEAWVNRLFSSALEELSETGIMRRALDGERLEPANQTTLEDTVAFLRNEADRLHEEVRARLMRGEGLSWIGRLLRFFGRGSRWSVAEFAKAFLAALAVLAAGVLIGWACGAASSDNTGRRIVTVTETGGAGTQATP